MKISGFSSGSVLICFVFVQQETQVTSLNNINQLAQKWRGWGVRGKNWIFKLVGFKQTKLVLMRNRFFDSASCTKHNVQLMNIDLVTLIILPVLQICDALLNTCFSV